MPVETTTTETIICDNPACPGTSGLDPHVRTGWLFVSSEVYGEPTQQHVFCSSECVAAAATDSPALFGPSEPRA